MGGFDSSLFRALAAGPDGEPIRKSDRRRYWDEKQRKMYADSANLLYRAIMLRAGALMERTGQDSREPESERMVEVHFAIRFTSKASDRPDNGAEAERHKGLPKFLTDNHGMYVSIMEDARGEAWEESDFDRAVKDLILRGLACPPPVK